VERARKKNPAAAHADLVESAVSENVKLVAKDIQGQSAVMKKMVAEGKVRIVGAKYDLDDGLVQMIPVDE
jgi:carbonic anhydrase